MSADNKHTPTRYARPLEGKTRQEIEIEEQLMHYRVSLVVFLLKLGIVSAFTYLGVNPALTHLVRLLLWNVHAVVICNSICLILLQLKLDDHYRIIREHQDLLLGVILGFTVFYITLTASVDCLCACFFVPGYTVPAKVFAWIAGSLVLYKGTWESMGRLGLGELAAVLDDDLAVVYTALVFPVMVLY